MGRVRKRSQRVTKSLVESTKPDPEGDVYLWDDLLTGFGVRVKPSGIRSYILQYRNRYGRQRRCTLGKHGVLTTEEARKAAKDHLAAARLGKDPLDGAEQARRAPHMDELLHLYLKNHLRPKRKASTIIEYQRLWRKHLSPVLGKRSVLEIKRTHVEELHRSFAQVPYQANRMLSILSSLMTYAERLELRPQGTNPCRFVERYPERRRERYLSPQELARLGEVLAVAEAKNTEPASAVLALRLLALTGMRKSEVLQLRWQDVDFERQLAHLSDSKTGPKVVPLSEPARDLLAKTPRCLDNPYVCWGKRPGAHFNGLQKVWERLRIDAGLEDVRIHDLRHTFASYGAAEGLGLYQIGKVLGHAQASTTERYAHLGPDPVRDAADRIGRRVADAMKQISKGEDGTGAQEWTH
jgi:integrase